MELKQVKNIINMLKSTDVEDHVIALEVLEQQSDKKAISVQITFCFKYGNASVKTWEQNASTSYNHMVKMFGKKPSFSDVYKGVMKHKLPVEQMQMFVILFGEHLTEQCKASGYNFIEGIHIDVKIKEPPKLIMDEN